MNNFLNTATKDSHLHQPGRVRIDYKHTHEIDEFRRLTDLAFKMLPPAVQKRPLGREPKIRTTTDKPKNGERAGPPKACILKIPLSNLHIYNPRDEYDCRISMNLECNLLREGVDPYSLGAEPTAEKPAPPARKKDRMSYKHLAYQVDLTKVDVDGMPAKYELELEVDTSALRQQLVSLRQGQESGFTNIVEGFLDNTTFLMATTRRAPG